MRKLLPMLVLAVHAHNHWLSHRHAATPAPSISNEVFRRWSRQGIDWASAIATGRHTRALKTNPKAKHFKMLLQQQHQQQQHLQRLWRAESQPLMAKNHLKWPMALQKAQRKGSAERTKKRTKKMRRTRTKVYNQTEKPKPRLGVTTIAAIIFTVMRWHAVTHTPKHTHTQTHGHTGQRGVWVSPASCGYQRALIWASHWAPSLYLFGPKSKPKPRKQAIRRRSKCFADFVFALFQRHFYFCKSNER